MSWCRKYGAEGCVNHGPKPYAAHEQWGPRHKCSHGGWRQRQQGVNELQDRRDTSWRGRP
eukprot:858098-Pyramimonas_sp.AAC.1